MDEQGREKGPTPRRRTDASRLDARQSAAEGVSARQAATRSSRLLDDQGRARTPRTRAATTEARTTRTRTQSAEGRNARTRSQSDARATRHRTTRTSGGSNNDGWKKYLPYALIALGVIVAIALIFAIVNAIKGCTSSAPAENSSSSSEVLEVAPEKKQFSVSFVSTGDLIFWREVADYIDMNGGASAMANIADYLASADVTIANVESPLSDDDSEPVYNKDVYIIGRPAAIESIKNSGIDLVSLANNHIMDYTGPALKDTIDALDSIGVVHAGAGMTESEAEALAEYEVNGVSIGFLSWTDIVPDYFIAYQDEPGVVSARLNMEDALRRVREAKETHDIVIVSMHWGIEHQHYTNEYLQDDPAHALCDAGADVILGNHPHVMQGIEFYNGSLISYAQGNCVFCQVFEGTHESYLLNFDITDEGIKNVVVTPLYLSDDYGIPDFATGDQALSQLEQIRDYSVDMNTNFEIRDGKAYLTPMS